MIAEIAMADALMLYNELGPGRKIPTLSPEYVQVDSHRASSGQPTFLCYREAKSFWLNAVLRSPIQGTTLFDHQSPYGYGGPVHNSDESSFLHRAHGAYEDWCRYNNTLAEFMRLHPLAAEWQAYYGEVSHNRWTVFVDTARSDFREGYTERCSRSLRKARRHALSCHILDGADIPELFPDMYWESMDRLDASPFYRFPLSYFSAISSWGNAKLVVVKDDNEVLVAAAIILVGSDIVEYHLGCSNERGRELGASFIMHDFIIETAVSMGLKAYYLGGGTSSESNNGLLLFKGGFSKERASFRIASKIFMPNEYGKMKDRREWKFADRVLFYRDEE